MDDLNKNAVDNDLGLPRGTSSGSRGGFGRTEVARVSGDLQRQTEGLMTISAPETLVQKAMDWLVPSRERKEKRRGEGELVRQEVEFRTGLHQLVKQTQITEMETLARVYCTTCELAAAEEVAMRGLTTAARVDAEAVRTGKLFDQSIEESMTAAMALATEAARSSAGFRIQQRRTMMAEVERTAMEGVQAAMRQKPERP